MVRHHHERFDGTGYPAGLLGEQIPVGARIIAVADTFDALTSERPYRAAIPHKKALEIIGGVAGTQLDPVAVRAFIKCYSGKRAVLFWTLLAVSPQRAVALLSGRSSWRASLGSTATVAMPAALAALVAAAFGSAGNISRVRDQVHLAKSPSASYAPKAKQQSATTHHVAAAHAAKSPAPPSSPKFVKLVRKATRPRRLSRKPSAVSRHHRHRSHPIVRRSHHRRRHRPVKSVGTTPAQPPVSPGSPVGVPSASAPAPPEPTSKQDCMDGGWANFTGFSNQGLCIAWVEHNVLH
jgi:hypothetical protein